MDIITSYPARHVTMRQFYFLNQGQKYYGRCFKPYHLISGSSPTTTEVILLSVSQSLEADDASFHMLYWPTNTYFYSRSSSLVF